MNTHYKILVIILIISFNGFSNEYDWGKTGHRTVGQIAEKKLSKTAKKNILKLLKGQSLAYVSTYADNIKSDKRFKKYYSWHYVNFSFGKKYGDETPNKNGDLVQAIKKCVAVLKEKKSSEEDKTFYLKMLVHFIGDLHQPLHVGRGEDKGGNDIQVRWFNKGSNLHEIWDSSMIDHYGMSYTELSMNMESLSNYQIKAIEKGSILDWVNESQTLAKKIYASAKIGEKLGYKYMYDFFPVVQSQLQKGGVRLAKILNDIYN